MWVAALRIEELTLQLGQEQKYSFTLLSGPCKARHRAKKLAIPGSYRTSHAAKGTLALHQRLAL